jgi:hypothetical protein
VVSAPPAAPRVREALEEVRAPAKEAVEPVEAVEGVGAPEAVVEDNLQNKMCKKKGQSI